MTKKRTPQELIEKAQPVLQPYLADHKWFREFSHILIETARKMTPSKTSKATYALCLKVGMHWQTANHFANACRYLAILRKHHEKEFLEAIRE